MSWQRFYFEESAFKNSSVFRTKTVRRLFPRMKIVGRHRKPHIIGKQSAMDGGDIQKPWMNRGKTEIRRFRRPFGYFWAAPKVSQPVEAVDKQNGIHLIVLRRYLSHAHRQRPRHPKIHSRHYKSKLSYRHFKIRIIR